MYQLIKDGKNDKAKKIIEMSLTKMPVDYYGYYTAVDPFADGYYKVGEPAKARELLKKLMKKYQQNLMYYKQFNAADQNFMGSDIYTDIERYRNLLTIMKDNNDLSFYNQNKGTFNTFVAMYERFGLEKEW